MNICSNPYKQYHFLKESNDNFQMQYVNGFKILRFLAEVAAKLQNNVLFIQFKHHSSGRKDEN